MGSAGVEPAQPFGGPMYSRACSPLPGTPTPVSPGCHVCPAKLTLPLTTLDGVPA